MVVRKFAVNEQREGGRIGRTLNCVENLRSPASWLGLLSRSDDPVYILCWNSPVILLDGIGKERPQLMNPFACEG